MISRIEGELVAVHEGRAAVRCGHIQYELLIPACEVERLEGEVGRTVAFETHHYLESHGQGASYLPRLIGFGTAEQRAFFELFTTVKGLGNRKALRALQRPIGEIALAIAHRDAKRLTELPEIGKRLAETIVAELSGKVDAFIDADTTSGTPSAGQSAGGALLRDAVAVMTMLGEPQQHARDLLERAMRDHPDIDQPDQLVSAAYRLKETV